MFGVALLAVAGCGRNQAAIPTEVVGGAIPADAGMTLERTGCFGMCPSYAITISADGAVRYEGKHFVKTVGAADGSITSEDLRALINAFEAIDYWSYHDAYGAASSDPGSCESEFTDAPSTITSLTLNGKTKRIEHYHGCQGFDGEQELTALEKRIDSVARTDQ